LAIGPHFLHSIYVLIVKNLLDSVDWSSTPLARFMAA